MTKKTPAPMQPRTGIDYNPRTRSTPAADIRKGDVVLERPQHPAEVVQVRRNAGRFTFDCRYLWQSPRESMWALGPFAPTALIEKAVR